MIFTKRRKLVLGYLLIAKLLLRRIFHWYFVFSEIDTSMKYGNIMNFNLILNQLINEIISIKSIPGVNHVDIIAFNFRCTMSQDFSS